MKSGSRVPAMKPQRRIGLGSTPLHSRNRWIFSIPILCITLLTGCSTSSPSGPELRVQWKGNAIYELEQLLGERGIQHNFDQDSRRWREEYLAKIDSTQKLQNQENWHEGTQSNLEVACEIVLTEFLADKNETIRCSASVALARMGTTSALAKALCILTNDPSAQIRAEVAGTIAQLHSMDLWERAHPTPTIQTTNSSGFGVSISRCFEPPGRLPKDANPGAISEALAHTFLSDDGTYKAQFIDRFPLMPFIHTKEVVTLERV